MAKWKANNIPRQDDKKVIITGANSGIGYQAARYLALSGATVIMACRSLGKAARAARKIEKESTEVKIETMHLDLSSLNSVEAFARQYMTRYDKLDILINNAGVMATPYRKTEDGFEWQFGINHLGHFALTGRLIDLLKRAGPSRVVTVTSIAHFNGSIHFDDLSAESWYGRMTAYRQSKLANLLFAYELHKRFRRNGYSTISLAAHPGISSTNIVWLPFPVNYIKRLVLMSARKGALPVLMAATHEKMQGQEYIGPAGPGQGFGFPAILKSSEQSYNEKTWKKLWDISQRMTGVYYLDS